MKNLTSTFLLLCSVLLICSCGSAKFGELGAPKGERSAERYGLDDSLGDVLKRYPGVQVREAGPSATVTIRTNDSNSITLDTRPLYVLNGVMIGHDYDKANNLVVVQEISSIKIKKSLSETAIYGSDGRNGVIEIKTKMNKDNKHSDKKEQGLD